MRTTLLLLVFSMSATVFGQTSQEAVKDILGERFISQTQAKIVWHEQKSDELLIPYSEAVLNECWRLSAIGEADYYLVPILGLNKEKLSIFWNIISPDIPLQVGQPAWRLINFKDNRILFFSWEEESLKASEKGMTLLSTLDYLEAVATINLVHGADKSSNFSKFYFSCESLPADNNGVEGDFFTKGKTIVYSANLSSREALVLDFPKENFLPGSLKPNEFSFVIFAKGQNEVIVIQFEKALSSLKEKSEIDYDVSSTECL
ncbi:MAG: hypothetical protein WCN88_02280 [Candidatus Falkowbacteria bacterium]